MANNFQNFQIPQNTMTNQQSNQAAQLNNMMVPTYQSNPILFPQPVGNVYNLNSAAEISNVPTTGAGISVGLCLNENILYVKTLQNGAPALLTYRLGAIEGSKEEVIEEKEKIRQMLQNYEERFSTLEKQLSQLKDKVGGNKIEWQI